MTALAVQGSAARGRFQGVRQVVAFNWPQYMVAIGAAAIIAAVGAAAGLPTLLTTVCWVIAGLLCWWTIASLAASHWVYDRSSIMRLGWLGRTCPTKPARWMSVHSGFDEFSSLLRQAIGTDPLLVADIFDPQQMTERSITRARAIAAGWDVTPSTSVQHSHLPVAPESCDAVFVLFAAHELRSASAKCELFTAIKRALCPKGLAIVAEHLRDAANVTAFGPGSLHFASAHTWYRAFREAGLKLTDEFRITPFVRVYVLGKAA